MHNSDLLLACKMYIDEIDTDVSEKKSKQHLPNKYLSKSTSALQK